MLFLYYSFCTSLLAVCTSVRLQRITGVQYVMYKKHTQTMLLEENSPHQDDVI